MLTITRKDLLLTINDNVIPAMGSSDVPVKFVNDEETYVGFSIEPRVGYYVNGFPKSTVCEYDTSSNIIKIPAEAFKNKGILVIAIALIDNADSNHIEVTKELALEVTPAPNGNVILPATETWQTAVKNLVEQLYNQDYKPQFDQIEEDLSGLVEEAENQQSKAKEQQTQIDNAIEVMGDYEIVQDNPTQIRFKKGDGTYGNTVNLGDNLASKSMVNAGYDTYSGNSYSGTASDYGLEIEKAEGNYYQETTNGYQLFDASKLSTKTQGGATVTNNGDGSFTVSGSGNLTTNFNLNYDYTHEETLKFLKEGEISLNEKSNINPYIGFQLISKASGSNSLLIGIDTKFSTNSTITQEMLNDETVFMRIIVYGVNGNSIVSGAIKPMLYQDGDGTWEPFTGGEPSPNPNYAQEPKFFEPSNVYSIGKNLFNGVLETGDIINGNNTNYTGMLRSKDYINVKPNHEYCFSIDGILNRLVIACYDEDKNYLNETPEGIVCENGVFKTLDKTKYIRFRSFRADKTKFETSKDKIQLEEGSVATSYAKYCKSVIPTDITLRALPNGVCDTYENGVVTRRIGEVTFDGSDDEFWNKNGSSNNNWLYYITYHHIKAVALSNKLEHKNLTGINGDSSLDRVGFNLDFSESVIYINIGYYMQQEGLSNNNGDLKTYLQSHPIKVWYELAEPTTEQVDLPVIPSYYPYTNAWHDSEVEASELTWNILARQYGSGQTTIKKDEAVLTELDLNTERTVSPTTVKVQLQDSEGKVLYLETSSENVYIQSGRFSGKTVQQVLENSIQAISVTDEYIEVDVPDSMTQSIDEEFLVDEVDESETETE